MGARIDLDCGIAFRRIAGWLDEELGATREGNSGDRLTAAGGRSIDGNLAVLCEEDFNSKPNALLKGDFNNTPTAPLEGDVWVFRAEGGTCFIRAGALENRAIGTISLERTCVVAEGDNAAVDTFHRLFTLRFISAGG